MGYAPIRCAANGCYSSWQPALPPFMLTVHSYKLWCWRDVEPNHILSYISNVQMDKGHSHDDMSPSSVNCILQWLLMLMHCAGSTRTRAVELLRECLCKVPLECCQPTSLFSLARDLAIFIRTLSSIQYPRDNCILKTLELTAVRLAMHGYTGKLKVFHPKHLAGFVSEFARLKAVRQRVGGSAELTFSLDFCVATADGLLQLTTPPTNIRKVLACAPAVFKKQGSSTVYNAAAVEELVPSSLERLPLSVMAVRLLSHPASQDPTLLHALIKVGYAALQDRSWPWHLGHSHCQLLMAVALKGTTVALRKAAIMAKVRGGLADLVALDDGDRPEEGQPAPITEPLAHCAWCIRRSALRCLLSISRTSGDDGIKALASRIVIARKAKEHDPRVADALRELDKRSQTQCEPEGSDGPVEVWNTNELLRKQFAEVLSAKPSVQPTRLPINTSATRASPLPLEQPVSEAPELVVAPAVVHGPTPTEKAHAELKIILLSQVAAAKGECEAEKRAEQAAYMEMPAKERAEKADRAAKIRRKAAEQALGLMPPSEMATLSLEETAEINTFYEWEPSKVAALDPSLYQDADTSDYAERKQLTRNLAQKLSNVDPSGFERSVRAREGRRGLQPLVGGTK